MSEYGIKIKNIKAGTLYDVNCSIECFKIYTDLVLEAREKGLKVDKLPERTDMSKSEIETLMKAPIKEVTEKTKKDLEKYADNVSASSLSELVTDINKTIDNTKANKKRK